MAKKVVSKAWRDDGKTLTTHYSDGTTSTGPTVQHVIDVLSKVSEKDSVVWMDSSPDGNWSLGIEKDEVATALASNFSG